MPSEKRLGRRRGTSTLISRFTTVILSLLTASTVYTTINMYVRTSTLFASLKTTTTFSPAASSPPRLAYLVSGSKGELGSLWRTLLALYHPRNQYLVHLDLEAPAREREELRRRVAETKVFREVGNVRVMKSNMVTYKGPTMVANTLHACAILLRESKDWDWFINLSASDYPLATQDDIIYSFSKVPRNLNFVKHTGRLGWKEWGRARPLIIDPGLYKRNKSNIFYATKKRQLPGSFKLYTGSAWMALTREFIEYSIWGWDNLPRTTLMYYTNFVSSPEGYFHTVICNAPYFNTTVVNHDLHFIAWDNPPQQHPRYLSVNDRGQMLASGAAFARKFAPYNLLLDKIDAEILGRRKGGFTPGAWCRGEPDCSEVGNIDELRPGSGSQRVMNLINRVILSSRNNSCQYT